MVIPREAQKITNSNELRNFSLESYVLKNKNGYRLYFGSKSKKIFPELIEKHILPSLKYKIR